MGPTPNGELSPLEYVTMRARKEGYELAFSIVLADLRARLKVAAGEESKKLLQEIIGTYSKGSP